MLNKIITSIILFSFLFSVVLSGCSPSLNTTLESRYLYFYKMTEPEESKKLFYQDNYIIVQFKIDGAAIRFQLQNVSASPISIDWEKVSIGVNNRIFRVKNSSNFYSVNNPMDRGLVIPPLGFIQEIVIPRENINFQNGMWSETDFFPTSDRGSLQMRKYIPSLAGNTITLNLSLIIGEISQNYPFTFKISRIARLKQNYLPPKKERPEPPAPIAQAKTTSVGSNYIPIIIAAGILGVAAYLLTQEKKPAGDL